MDEMVQPSDFGDAVLRLRLAKGWTQKELAKRCNEWLYDHNRPGRVRQSDISKLELAGPRGVYAGVAGYVLGIQIMRSTNEPTA